ncbi:hypothetical protein DUU53_25600 [Salmonella enterica subsp. enterica serovar Berlin]|nr:hypothetical protein [Salmonella enterica]EBY0806371.1 hypothetical protein [Salmonella enterica subsp. enterica serovar Berlin]
MLVELIFDFIQFNTVTSQLHLIVIAGKVFDGIGGQPVGQIAKSERADMLVLNSREPFLAAAGDNERLDRWIFACAINPITHVMTGRRWEIEERRNQRKEKITSAFIQVIETTYGLSWLYYSDL